MYIYLNWIYKLSSILFIITLLLFGFFLFQDIFLNPIPSGDEGKYLSDLEKANEDGVGKAILDGTSIPFLLLSFFLNKLIDNPLFALKMTSLLVGIFLFCVLILFDRKFLHLNSVIRNSVFLWLSYLFIIQATIFLGVNDILLDFFGTIFFISLIAPKAGKFEKILLTSIFLALMLLTRKMALTYIVVFFLLFFFVSIFVSKNPFFNIKNGFMTLALFGFFLLIFNSYSLMNQGTLSFDDKPLGGKVNWAQWDYHNALLVDAGVQDRFSHVGIKETEKFLLENGKNSLPSTFLEMIYFNPSLTFKEFFIDMATGLKYIIRQTGLLIFPFFLFLWFRFRNIYKTKSVTPADFIYLFSFFYVIAICFIVITNIQARWFMLFLPITILLIAEDLSKLSKKEQLLFSTLNHAFLIIMSVPYLLNKLNGFP